MFIEQGQVLVDGEVMSTLGSKVSPQVTIKLLKEAQNKQGRKVTILLNKPVGFVSTQPEKGYTPATELITPEYQFEERRQPRL